MTSPQSHQVEELKGKKFTKKDIKTMKEAIREYKQVEEGWVGRLKAELPQWFGVHETIQTRQAGGIADFEVHVTGGAFEAFIIPEMISFIRSALQDQKREMMEKIKSKLQDMKGSTVAEGFSEAAQMFITLIQDEK
jgi:hypothetical protein